MTQYGWHSITGECGWTINNRLGPKWNSWLLTAPVGFHLQSEWPGKSLLGQDLHLSRGHQYEVFNHCWGGRHPLWLQRSWLVFIQLYTCIIIHHHPSSSIIIHHHPSLIAHIYVRDSIYFAPMSTNEKLDGKVDCFASFTCWVSNSVTPTSVPLRTEGARIQTWGYN